MPLASTPTDLGRPASAPELRAPLPSAPRCADGRTGSRIACSGRLAGLAAALIISGCKAADAAVELSKGAGSDDGALQVPALPADGPRLVALRAGTPVLARPQAGARKLGELYPGAAVVRSSEPYGREGCSGGWYAIRPRGFVCAGDGATLRTELLSVLPAPPDMSRPLPYRYGRARTQGAPAYVGVPSREELRHAEPDLDRHLERVQRSETQLGASANDVPLDTRGVASGPPVLLPGGDGIGEDGRRTEAGYFLLPTADAIAPLPPLAALGIALGAKDSARVDLRSALKAAPLRKGSGVAITRTFTTGETDGRRLGATPDGRLIPVDRLQAALGSTWHGLDVEQLGLPVAFIHRHDVNTWSLGRGKASPNEEELERRTGVPLTGKFRTVGGVRFEEARDGFWLRAQDLVVIVRRTRFPDFAKGSQRWIDVSLANQTLTAYEGQKPIYATLISSGRDQLRDPGSSASTARGTFRVRSKHVTRNIDPREVADSFDVADAPWVIDFAPGHAMTGMYWSAGVGEAQGFHDIAMTPIDARRLFLWTEPQVPEGWHAVYSGNDEGTLVHVRP
ncbi:L,D-transpeptidase family protein [Sorangium sp. So ce406]|uniref:L,D-transpeptidase family protein n=1 Tax=Sorangium sp. So ce406 TaxID=3133311 RepID=UPI003F5BCBDF